MPTVDLRPATPADAEVVARIWSEGWPDGHLGNVPDELVAARTWESFRSRAADRVAGTTVVTVDGVVTGFFMLAGTEVEQVYVAAPGRGTGIAALLLTEAERQLAAAGHDEAWLAVVPGNARARRFYERCGWADDGPLDHRVPGPDGPITVPVRRYVKPLGVRHQPR